MAKPTVAAGFAKALIERGGYGKTAVALANKNDIRTRLTIFSLGEMIYRTLQDKS